MLQLDGLIFLVPYNTGLVRIFDLWPAKKQFNSMLLRCRYQIKSIVRTFSVFFLNTFPREERRKYVKMAKTGPSRLGPQSFRSGSVQLSDFNRTEDRDLWTV